MERVRDEFLPRAGLADDERVAHVRRQTRDDVEEILHDRAAADHPAELDALGQHAFRFEDVFPFYGGKPDLTLHEVRGPFEIAGKTIVPIPVTHGRATVLGYRFGPLAYVTDAKTVPESSVELLRGVDTLVLNALRERPHPTHLSFSEAVKLIEQIAPRRTYLVHLSHETSHVDASALLPQDVEVAWDGLTITVDE